MTAFDKKINQIATRHRWNIEKQARAAVPCYIIAAKAAQREKAVQWNAVEVFNEIYA